MNFGEHLTIDGYDGDTHKLNDRELVFKCLDELPGLLGMDKLAKPEVYFAKGNGGKDPGGWSGFVVSMQSHISIHTFPARGFMSADVYTCHNDMNTNFILDYFTKQFGLKDIERNFLKRGTRYPDKDIV